MTQTITQRFRPGNMLIFSWTISFYLLGCVSALTVHDLYPYGEANGDSKLAYQDESSSSEVKLMLPITYWGVKQTGIYVNQNGLVSFRSEIPYFNNKIIDDYTYSLIAIFYADVDTYDPPNPNVGIGTVYYREEYSNQALLTSASKLIRKKFDDAQDFTARSIFIVTWDQVGYYLSNSDKRNTFQLLIISNDTASYSAFMYADINWVKSQGGKDNKEDAPAQVGFVSDDGRHQKLPASGEKEMMDIGDFTNVDSPGLFLFRISGGTPVDPRRLVENSLEEEADTDYVEEDEQDTMEYGNEIAEDEPRGLMPIRPPDTPQQSAQAQATTTPDYGIAEEQEALINKTEEYTYFYDDYKEPDCPINPYGDMCPSDCTPTTDDMDCPICICQNPPAAPAQEPEYCQDPLKEYKECGASCQIGCDNMANPPQGCTRECVSGCFCREGYIFHDSRRWQESPCIPLTSCPNQDTRPQPQPQPQQPRQPQPQRPPEPSSGIAPALTRGITVDEGRGQSCASIDPGVCSGDGRCEDFPGGYCCACNPGFYGNGKECLKESEPQRINGFFSGTINGKTLPQTDLHTYVISTDGRAYTALSEIDQETGPSLLLLNSVGGVMGWLFAKVSGSNAYNGFALTGGVFNRTVTVHIADTHTVTIQQEFSGKDIFHYFKAKFFVTGQLPIIPLDAQVTYSDFEEEYRRVSPGVVKSYSTPIVRAGNQEFRLTVDQTIKYTECPSKTFDKQPNMRVRVERSYVVYDTADKIVRFASMNTVTSAGIDPSDPCRPGAHSCTGTQQSCVRDGQSFRCLCLDGYEMSFQNEIEANGVCVDMDECSRAIHTCDPNADCLNTDGSFVCRCRPGFRGTGHKCIAEVDTSCGGYTCDPNAQCLSAPRGGVECKCNSGYYGNGVQCRPEQRPQTTTAAPSAAGVVPCSSHGECNTETGMCDWNTVRNQYECKCRPGYVGNGITCTSETEQTCDIARNCAADADCILESTPQGQGYKCRCREGFSGDGKTCQPVNTGPTEMDCNQLNNCHPDAECVPNYETRRYECQCKSGFNGDGYTCTSESGLLAEEKECFGPEDCHAMAHCVESEYVADKNVCLCLPGHHGDGINFCDKYDECAPGEQASDCSAYATCAYNQAAEKYSCVCNPGYQGDGKLCEPQGVPVTPPSAPSCQNQPTICHANAECVANYETRMYDCQCRSGFTGNGYDSCVPEEQGCDTLANCDSNADCIFDSGNGKYFCKCDYGYIGDGISCRPEVSCLDRPELCHEKAQCVPDSVGYACRCQRGYHGDGRMCNPDSELRGRALIFGQGMSLVQRGLGPDEPGRQLIVVPFQTVVSVAFDCMEERLYWGDVAGHAIRSAKMNGEDIVTVLNETMVNSPEGIAIDWASRNLYYADSEQDCIGVVTLDGKYHKVLLENLVNPRALAVDVIERKLYYSDWNRDRPVIGRMGLNGADREDFITDDIALPNSMVILSRRRELCWVDAGRQRLECINVNGQGRRVVHAPLPYPFGLAVHEEETFFTTDWEDKNIHTVSVYGGEHRAFNASIGGSGKLYGMVALEEECPSGQTECGNNYGGCEYLCLPTSTQSGKECICPDNLPEGQCNSVE